MSYIVLDLEWNQAMSSKSSVFNKLPIHLRGEIIEIGAVKLNEDMTPGEEFTIDVRPVYFKRMHYKVKKITGFDKDRLAHGVGFPEALERFRAWCGDDVTFLTWGCDDVSVLQQNIDFFECGDIHLSPLYDIQKLFTEVHRLKDRPSLQKAMELMEIAPDEEMAFHNAKNDAWYTALVFRTLPDPSLVLQHALQPKSLIHKQHKSREKTAMTSFPSLRAALESEIALKPVCPRCGRNLALDGEYVLQSPDKYISLGKCQNHGKMLLRLTMRPEEGHVLMRRSVAPANHSNIAYLHTKQLQARQRASQRHV